MRCENCLFVVLSVALLKRCIWAARGPPVQRKPLKQRDYEVDLESRLGKTQVSHFYLLCLKYACLLNWLYMLEYKCG